LLPKKRGSKITLFIAANDVCIWDRMHMYIKKRKWGGGEGGDRQGQRDGMDDAGGGGDGKRMKYDVQQWGEVLVAKGQP
jgi:hypothetical protein